LRKKQREEKKKRRPKAETRVGKKMKKKTGSQHWERKNTLLKQSRGGVGDGWGGGGDRKGNGTRS